MAAGAARGGRSRTWIGVDTGGTFTDFVLVDRQGLRVHKVLSTPAQPERAILQGIADLRLDSSELGVVHGSTVATNTVLEGKGARTVFVTNRGLRDLLTIGRQARRALYDLQPPVAPPPVPRELCLETGGRLGFRGEVVEPLTESDLAALVRRIAQLAPQAVAISLLFSFVDDRFERRIEAALPPGLFVSRSSEVLPEYREYERGVATWLNAWVGPLVGGYLERLGKGLPGTAVAVMRSSGGTIGAQQASRRGVELLLSGPAGGLIGARFIAQAAGRERILTFDMGGTSTDVALVEGEVRLTSEGRIAGYPVAVPMVDMHSIGAGGGSIAYVDAGGLLQVGPESAGASPGPACYGRGGREPTVTDANLILGRLLPEAFLGGAMRLEREAAEASVARLGTALGCSAAEAAEGVVRVANEHMARALRVISVQRGIDPRGYTLLSFGGAGGLHVCALAESLGIRSALVPAHAGVLSALGMRVAPRSRELSRSVVGPIEGWSQREIDEELDRLIRRGLAELKQEGVPAEDVQVERSADLRYLGQSYTLHLPWAGPRATADAFHHAHEVRYGHRMELVVELVNVRVSLRSPPPALRLARLRGGSPPAPPWAHTRLFGVWGQSPVWRREALVAGQRLSGPGLVCESFSTTYLAPGWVALVDAFGNLLLDRSEA